MSTIASLMMALGQGGPKPYGDIREQTARTRGGELSNETALMKLADLKRSQASEEVVMAAIQKDPDLRRLFFGDSLMGGLGQAPGAPGAPAGPGGMPAPGPITQSPLGGGPEQTIPAPPDASRFANVPPTGGGPIPPGVMGQTMPTAVPPQGPGPGGSVLGSLGPAGGMPGPPQGAPQAQRNPVSEMAMQDPRAALMLQQQLEGRQDAAMKRQEQGIQNRIKVVDYLARMAQGTTDQDSWTQFREEADRVQPGAGGRLPQMYSKEARDRIVAQGLEAKETMTLQVADLKARADMRGQLFKEQQAAAGVPKYTEDSTLNVAIDRRMQQAGIPRGTPPSEAILTQAQEDVQQGKVDVSAAQGVGAAKIERTEKPLEGAAGKDAANLKLLRTMTDDISALRKDDYTGPVVGRTGYLREQTGQMDQQETAFRSTLQNMKDILGRLRSGANIPVPELANLERLLPTANDLPEVFQSKMQSFQRALEQQLDSITSVGTTGRQQLREETKPTTPRVGEKPQGQAPAGTGGNTFNDADIATTMANPRNKGKTRQQIVDGLLAKGMTYR